MPIRPINFLTIRPHHGSQHNGFEEFCCQLAALDTSLGTPFHRKGIGADAGLECYRVEPDGSETGWQAKYFFKFGSSEVSQLAESLKQAITGHPNLKRFIVCLPIDLSDGRVGKRKSQRDLWDDWKVACVNTIAPRSLTIELWGAFQLTERLSRSDVLHAGRRAFWFDDIQFSQSWFRSRFERARAALGRRYTPELNVELPIRRTLAAFARDPMLARDVEHCADRLDEALRSALRPMRDALTGTTDTDIDRLQELVRGASIAIRSAPLGPADDLPLTKWRSALTAALSSAASCIESIWNLPQEEGRAREKTSAARHYAWRLHETLTEVDEKLASPAFQLANPRRLLVAGEAGVGKSHLLADVAKNHIEQGLPAILVLGAWFSDGDPWAQITEQLGLTTTPPDEILGALDAAAEAAGTRALIMIDAINERQGIAVWSARLGAFLEVAASFPRVAIVVSCRTTYLPYIISDRLDEKDLPRIKHPGFAGHAAEAARRYLDQRGVVRMAAPHLAPEFENPLFLRTCCDLLERRGERELPRGLAGVTSIFEFYFGAIAETLTHRMGLDARLRIVERALNALTQRMVEAGIGYLPIQEVIALVEGIHPSHGRQEQSLLFQLENEGVIAIEPVKHDATIEEQVRFTFERMSDHRIAARLLEHHVGNAGPAPALAAGGPLHEYVAGPDSHRFAGIAEALSVQLPERYGVELMDLVQKNGARWDLWHAFEVSLLWRRQETFTRRTLELVSEMERRLGRDILLSILLSITTEPTNMFNADHLDRKLREFTMPERDVRWSTRVSRVAEEEDEHDPVGTLIEWTLANGLESMDEARARLAATALAWLLSLSHRAVRDRATKALATLLVNRPNLAAALVRRFADVDDPYVVDRVLAAAYGAAMRYHGGDGLAELARAAFDAVFARTPIIVHALIRDHARGIVELAASRGVLPSDIDIERARPPYAPGRSIEHISDSVVESFVQDYGRGSFHDEIYSSAISDGDFARYVIDRVAGNFLQLPLADGLRAPEEIYEEWRHRAIDPYPERSQVLQRLLNASRRLHDLPHDWILEPMERSGVSRTERERAEAERDSIIAELEKLLGEADTHEFRIRAAGFIKDRMWDKEAYVWQPDHGGSEARRWVAWRAHDLGWTAARFADFDRELPDRSRMEHRIERIGKKYQWIALHELTGRLADLAALKGSWRDEPVRYDGPWQIDIREMDPSMFVTGTPQRDRTDRPATWWSPHVVRWRRDPPEARHAWVRDAQRDVPDPVQQIAVSDATGQRWLVLDTSISRNQHVLVDGERVIHRMTWHRVTSMLVPKNDAISLIRHLSRSASERDHPMEVDLPSDAYLGEYAWHPSSLGAQDKWSLQLGRGKSITVYATVVDRWIERSGQDYSIDESFNLSIPSPVLMSGLDLRLADGRSLDYARPDGNVVFRDPSTREPGFSAAVVNRDLFLDFLRREDLEVVWTFTGNKSAHGGHPHRDGWGGELSYWGILTLVGGQPAGALQFEMKEPDARQLAAFLAAP